METREYSEVKYPTNRPAPKQGDIVWIQGFEFHVDGVRFEQRSNGRTAVRFMGLCTANPVNDQIRFTSFNNGVYGWYVD